MPFKTIHDFFVEAAIRAGAPKDLADKVDNCSSEVFTDGGVNYKVGFFLNGEDPNETFTIYGDGTFGYDGPTGSITGRLAAPHSRVWVRKMHESGMVLDYAKQLWGEYE